MKLLLVPRFLALTSVLCAAGLPASGQETDERHFLRQQLPQEDRLLEERLQQERLQGRRSPKNENDSDMVSERAQWFYHQRRYPLNRIPTGARLKALGQLKLMSTYAAAQPLASASWSLIGPQPTTPLTTFTFYGAPTVSGRVTALAVDPTNASIVYLGAADGGVWKTTNGGSTWTPLTDTQPSLSVGSIAIDPSNHNTIYIGTGEENYAAGAFIGDSYFGAGILKSTDGGSTWTQDSGPFVGPFGPNNLDGGAFIGALAVSPANSQVLLAAVATTSTTHGSGIYRSADGGNTWTLVQGGEPGTAVIFDPTNGNTAYAALGAYAGDLANNGIYKSTDGGQTWVKVLGETANVIGRVALAIAPSSTATLYAAIGNAANNSSSLLGLIKTTDGFTTFTTLTNTPDFCNPQCNYDIVVAVAPDNANVVYAGGVNQGTDHTVIRSLDGGTSWSVISVGANGGIVHTDTHAMAFSADSSTFYVGSDGGAWSTTNVASAPVSWTGLNSSLAITQFYHLSIHPTNVSMGFGGAQDNSIQKYAGSLTWTEVGLCGDGGYTAIDFTTPATVYETGASKTGRLICLQKSTSSGNPGTFADASTGININDSMSFIPPLVIDPSHSSTLYVGTNRIYQTTNGAGTWTAISPTLTGTTGGSLTTIAVAPSNSNTVYAGSDDGFVAVSTNVSAGTSSTWSHTSTVARSVTYIAVDPATSTTAYVTYSGFSGFLDALGHVFKTTDGGVTFTDISGNLPNIPVNAIVVDPDIANTLYIATDIGVFVTSNGGTTWSTLATGLPNVAVLALAFDHTTRTLRAGTHGRSVWDLSLSSTSFALTVTLGGTGSGTVTSSPTGINCPTTCSANFNSSTMVTLTAAAASSSTFAGWSGACTGTGTCSVTMSAAEAVTVMFNLNNPPAVTLSPASVSSGIQLVGTSSAPGTVTLTNTGGAPLTINSIGTLGANSGDFSVSQSCPSPLAASANCLLHPTFTPTAAGPRKSTISISDSAAGSPHTVILTGVGTVAGLSPTTLPFASQAVGTSSAAQTITLTNKGALTMNLWQIAILGANPGDFSQTHTCVSTLGAAANCTISVTFKPTATGARSATLLISDDGGGSPQAVTLTGMGM
jgi:hypothetical protein